MSAINNPTPEDWAAINAETRDEQPQRDALRLSLLDDELADNYDMSQSPEDSIRRSYAALQREREIAAGKAERTSSPQSGNQDAQYLKYFGINDANAGQDQSSEDPDAKYAKYFDPNYTPRKSDLGEAVKALGTGAYTAGKMVGQLGEFLTPEGSAANDFFKNTVKSYWAKKEEENAPDLEGRNAVAKAFITATSQVIPVLGSTLPTAGLGAIPSFLAASLVWGGSSFTESYDRAKKEGKTEDQAKEFAAKEALLNGPAMALLGHMGSEFVRTGANALLKTAGKDGLGEAIRLAMDPAWAKQFGKDALKNVGVTSTTLGGLAEGNAYLEREAGMEKAPQAGDSFAEGAATGAALTVLLSPLAALGAKSAAAARSRIRDIYQDPNAPLQAKLAAGEGIRTQLEGRLGKDKANSWFESYKEGVVQDMDARRAKAEAEALNGDTGKPIATREQLVTMAKARLDEINQKANPKNKMDVNEDGEVVDTTQPLTDQEKNERRLLTQAIHSNDDNAHQQLARLFGQEIDTSNDNQSINRTNIDPLLFSKYEQMSNESLYNHAQEVEMLGDAHGQSVNERAALNAELSRRGLRTLPEANLRFTSESVQRRANNVPGLDVNTITPTGRNSSISHEDVARAERDIKSNAASVLLPEDKGSDAGRRYITDLKELPATDQAINVPVLSASGVVYTQKASRVSRSNAERISYWAKQLFGKDVVWYHNEGPRTVDNGFTRLSDPNKVFLSIDAISAPHAGIFGHEFYHRLKADSPDIAAKFEKAVTESLKDNAVARYSENHPEAHFGDTHMREELDADLFGGRFTDNKFWLDVFSRIEDKSVVAKIADNVKNFFAHIFEQLKVRSGFGASNNFGYSEGGKSLRSEDILLRGTIRKIHNAAVEAAAEYINAKNPPPAKPSPKKGVPVVKAALDKDGNPITKEYIKQQLSRLFKEGKIKVGEMAEWQKQLKEMSARDAYDTLSNNGLLEKRPEEKADTKADAKEDLTEQEKSDLQDELQDELHSSVRKVDPKDIPAITKMGFSINKGTISGAPNFIASTKEILGQIKKMVMDAKGNQSHPEDEIWYKRAGEAIREYSHGDAALQEKLVRIVAKLSQSAGVDSNVTQVIKAAYQIANGEEVAVGRFPNKFREEFGPLMDAQSFDTSVKGIDSKLQNFYRNLHDETFNKNQWPDAVVIDRHAINYIFAEKKDTVTAAQYKFAERMFQLATDEYNKKYGTSLKPRQIQAILWGWQKRVEDAAKAEEAGIQYKADGTAWNYPEFFERGTANVTGEVIPSTAVADLGHLSMKERGEFQQKALSLIFQNGENMLAKMAGLVLYRQRESTGGYEQRINPNFITGALAKKISKESGSSEKFHRYIYDAVDRYARMWQFVFRQDAVPWFRADPEINPETLDAMRQSRADRIMKGGKGAEKVADYPIPEMSKGVMLEFDRALTDAEEADLFRSLQSGIDQNVGYSKIDPQRFAIVNFRGDDRYGFLPGERGVMSDAEFIEALHTSQLSEQLSKKLVGADEFGAESRYEYHDWKSDAEGKGILDAINKGSDQGREGAERVQPELSNLQEWLRGRQQAFDQLTAEYSKRSSIRPNESGEGRDRGMASERGHEVRYGSPTEGSSSVLGVHYSREQRNVLSTHHYGTGIKGAESERIKYSPDNRLRQRLYFYVDDGNGVRPEAGVGNAPHQIRLDNVYDATKTHEIQDGLPQDIPSDAWMNMFESAVIDKGYDGYVAHFGAGRAAVLLGSHHIIAFPHQSVKRSAVRDTYVNPRSTYRAYMLKDADRERLLQMFPPTHPRVIADHISAESLNMMHLVKDGPAKAEVIGYADHEGVQSLIVRVNGKELTGNGTPFHISWSSNPGVKVGGTGNIVRRYGYTKLDKPIPLDFPDGPTYSSPLARSIDIGGVQPRDPFQVPGSEPLLAMQEMEHAPPKDKPVILLFGGTLNPVHSGHAAIPLIGKKMLEYAGYRVDKVIVSPVQQGRIVQKMIKNNEDPRAATRLVDRTAMANRAFRGLESEGIIVDSKPSIEADAHFARTGKVSNRNALVDHFQKIYPDHTIINIGGEDTTPPEMKGFPHPVLGIAQEEGSYKGKAFLMLPRPEQSISSSQIRKLINRGEQVPSHLMDSEVARYYSALLGITDEAAIDGHLYHKDMEGFGIDEPPKTLPDDHPLLTPTHTKDMVTEDGVSIPRSLMARNIIKQELHGKAPAPEGRKPIVFLMGGGTATGKGTLKSYLYSEGEINPRTTIDIDSDEIKWKFPEARELRDLGDYRAAEVVHKESSNISKQMVKAAMEGRHDIVMDVTLRDPKTAERVINEYKAAGYEVRLYGTTVDPRFQLIRAANRAKYNWRFINHEVTLGSQKGFMQGWENNHQLADSARLYDTLDRPELIAHTDDGKLVQDLPDVYTEALERANVNENAKTLRELEPSRLGNRNAEDLGSDAGYSHRTQLSNEDNGHGPRELYGSGVEGDVLAAGKNEGTLRDVATEQLDQIKRSSVKDGDNDSMDQLVWLDKKATDSGFHSIDDLVANKPEEFMRLAEEWRIAHSVNPDPADVKHSSVKIIEWANHEEKFFSKVMPEKKLQQYDNQYAKVIDFIKQAIKDGTVDQIKAPLPSTPMPLKLQAAGLPLQWIYTDVGIIKKLFVKHGDDFKNVTPADVRKMLQDPAVILQSRNGPDEYDVITKHRGNGGPIIFALKTDSSRVGSEYSDIHERSTRAEMTGTAVKTVYAEYWHKGAGNLINRIGSQKILYADAEAARMLYAMEKRGDLPPNILARLTASGAKGPKDVEAFKNQVKRAAVRHIEGEQDASEPQTSGNGRTHIDSINRTDAYNKLYDAGKFKIAKSRQGRCHELAGRAALYDEGDQLLGVVRAGNSPIMIWHSLLVGPNGAVWDGVLNKWFAYSIYKNATDFQPVKRITPDEARVLALKHKVYPDQTTMLTEEEGGGKLAGGVVMEGGYKVDDTIAPPDFPTVTDVFKNVTAADEKKASVRLPDYMQNATPDQIDAYRKAGLYHVEPTWMDKLRAIKQDLGLKLTAGLADRFKAIETKVGHREYVLARMASSADGTLEAALSYGRVGVKGDSYYMKNYDGGILNKISTVIDGEGNRFFGWVAGHRAEELSRQGRENNFSKSDIAHLKALDQGTLPSGRDRATQYAEMLKHYQEANKDILDIAEHSGLTNAADRKTWERQMYVPFYRVLEDETYKGPRGVSGLINQTDAIKRLKGGKDILGDPLESVMRNWSYLLSASRKNYAAKEILKKADLLGAAKKVAKARDGDATVMVAGREAHYEVNDPYLLQAISSIENTGLSGDAVKVLAKFKHYLTAGVTFSPIFKVNNMLRDSITAVGVSKLGANMADNLYKGWQYTSRKHKSYADMLVSGGMIRMGSFLEGDRAEHTKRLIKEGMDPALIIDSKEKAKNLFSKMWDKYQDLGDRSENANRASLYQQLLRDGVDPLEAAFQARDLLDFGLQGNWKSVRFLSTVVPFLNARIQGLYKLGRAGRADTARLATTLGAVALASVGLMLNNKDDPEYQKIPDWARESYWWAKLGDKWVCIPKPFEIGAFGSIIEHGWRAAFSDPEFSGSDFARRAGSIMWDQLAFNPTPQLFKPMAEVYMNRDTFRSKDIETEGMRRMSKENRVGPNTSIVAEILGKANSTVATAVTGSDSGLSPVQIDHLIRGYFGWAGATSVMAADAILAPLTDRPVNSAVAAVTGLKSKESPTSNDIPIIGSFVKDYEQRQSKYVDMFYQQSREVSQIMADIRHFREIGEPDKAREIEQDNPQAVAMSKRYSHASTEMSHISKNMRVVRMSNMDADTKRAVLDDLARRQSVLAETIERQRMATQQ